MNIATTDSDADVESALQGVVGAMEVAGVAACVKHLRKTERGYALRKADLRTACHGFSGYAGTVRDGLSGNADYKKQFQYAKLRFERAGIAHAYQLRIFISILRAVVERAIQAGLSAEELKPLRAVLGFTPDDSIAAPKPYELREPAVAYEKLWDGPACQGLLNRLESDPALNAKPGRAAGQTAGPEGVNPEQIKGLFSPEQLAEQRGLSLGAVQKRLGRYRKYNHNGWIENPEATPREPRFLYDIAAVRYILNDMLSKQTRRTKTSSQCPAKKN